MRAALVVVEPASIPRNSGPSASFMSLLSILALACLSLKASYSSSSLKRGSILLAPAMDRASTCFTLFRIAPIFTGLDFSAVNAAPKATKYFEFSGNITSSGFNPSVCINLFLSSDIYVRGPPRNATFPFILCPHANPLIV